MKDKFLIHLNFAPKSKNCRLNWKCLGLYSSWPPQLLSNVKGAGASLTEMSSWERYLKLDRATQFSNGVCGSKYPAHHSRSSGLLIPLSYLIPTVIRGCTILALSSKGQFQTKSIISKTDFSSFSTYTYNIQEGNKHDYVVMLSSYILGNLALFDRVGVTATLYKNTCLCGWVGTAQADR